MTKKATDLMTITPHERADWCHLCGEWREDCVDVWGTELGRIKNDTADYIRICAKCAKAILTISKEDKQ